MPRYRSSPRRAVGRRAILGTLILTAAGLFATQLTVAAGPAEAESNGLGAKPLMGWSNWSLLGDDPTAAKIDAQADTVPERQSTMTLWSMAASPLILGTDLTHLDSTDLAMLKNKAVIGVDQDAIAAKRIVDSGDGQVFSKRESNGDYVIALFDTSASATTTVGVKLSAAGIGGRASGTDLWTGDATGTLSGTYSVKLGPGAVRLIRVSTTG